MPVETPQPELLPPGDGVPLDWKMVGAYLTSRGIQADAIPPRQFAGGLANVNYLVSVNGKPAVLRRPPPGELPPGANDMRREHRILSRLPDALPFVPRSLHLCEDAAVIGAPFQLLEYRSGIVVRSTIPAIPGATGPLIGQRLTNVMVDTLAAIHAVDPASVGLGQFGRPEGFLMRTVDGWRKRGNAAAVGAPPRPLAELGRWLEDHAVPDGSPTLLHNDFKLDNMILDPVALTPVAVLDWDQGTRGDPLFDLATLLSYWTEAGDPPAMHQLRQMPTDGYGFPNRRSVVARYAEVTNRDVSDFLFHRVLAMFKLGVVFLQLHARYRSGATSDPRYANFDELAEGLLDFTHDIAQGRAF